MPKRRPNRTFRGCDADNHNGASEDAIKGVVPRFQKPALPTLPPPVIAQNSTECLRLAAGWRGKCPGTLDSNLIWMAAGRSSRVRQVPRAGGIHTHPSKAVSDRGFAPPAVKPRRRVLESWCNFRKISSASFDLQCCVPCHTRQPLDVH